MAITITDKATERRIRSISAETGEAPAQVVARAVEALRVEQQFKQARRARLDAITPPRDPALTWDEIERDMNAIF